VSFCVEEPRSPKGTPALVLSLSATVTDDRITSVIGEDVAIWKVTIPTPHNDCLKSQEQLASFRATMRPLLDRIKAIHGQNTALHIFPAGPVSIAIELGRIRMPKADMPWIAYDQVNTLGGFVKALSIPEGESA
jgi:allophanate hydrolase subunit 2